MKFSFLKKNVSDIFEKVRLENSKLVCSRVEEHLKLFLIGKC